MTDGVLVVDKPSGMTSTDVLRRLRRPLGTKKMGHAGTLDPMATGVLVVGVNAATRLVPWLMAGRKRYRAEILLGTKTTTDDIEGDVVERRKVPDLSDEEIAAILERFTGALQQVPPSYSAIHVEGQRAHVLARRGEAPALAPRDVMVHALRLLDRDGERLRLDCDVGKGTYIRSLARDIGEHLGCGGTLSSLRRVQAQPFTESQAIPLDVLRAEGAPISLLPMWDALPMLPSLELEEEEARGLSMGQRRTVAKSRVTPAEYGDGGEDGDEPNDRSFTLDSGDRPEPFALRTRWADAGLLAIVTALPVEDDPSVVELKPLRVFMRPEELGSR